MIIQFDDVKKIILSDIEIQDLGGKRNHNRALEIFTDKGKVLITFCGEDVQFYKGGEDGEQAH